MAKLVMELVCLQCSAQRDYLILQSLKEECLTFEQVQGEGGARFQVDDCVCL